MDTITIKDRRIKSVGNSYCFLVDKAYIKNGQILKDKGYDLTISPSDQGDPNE